MMQNMSSRVIVIDDDPKIQQDFTKILSNEPSTAADQSITELDKKVLGEAAPPTMTSQTPHYDVATFSQGEQGVAAVEKSLKLGMPYMVAFVDMRMESGWNGIETIKHIWQVDPNVQVVICIAYSDYSWEQIIDELGLNDNLLILKKPFDGTVIKQFVGMLTRKWLTAQEARNQQAFLEEGIKKRSKELELVKATIQSSAAGIMVVSKTGDVLDYNENFKEMWQMPAEILGARQVEMIFQYINHFVVEPTDFFDQVKSLQDNPEETSFATIKLKDGRIYERHFQPQRLNDIVVGMVWSFRDVTHRVEMENKLQFQATHDALTKLPNRTLLYDRVQQAIASGERYHHSVALMFIHLEGVKEINEQIGHSAGDQLLKAVADRLTEHMRDEDTLARFGGCEFVFLARKVANESDINIVAERLLEKFQQPFKVDDKQIKVVAHIGISAYAKDGSTFPELLRCADLAMQQTKKVDHSSYQFYNRKGI